MKTKLNKSIVYACSLLVLLCAFTVSFAQTASPTTSAENKAKKLEPVKGWFTLAPNIEAFSVEMPGLTRSLTERQPMVYTYSDTGKYFFLLSSQIYERDENLTQKDHLKQEGDRFQELRIERYFKNSKDIEKSEPKWIELEGHPGREYKMKNGGRIWMIRLYRTDNRLYALEVLFNADEKSSVDRFFKSFTFKREKPLQFLEDPEPASKYPMGSPVKKP